MRSSTALDALIAELLGDVVKLHDEVKTLQQTVQAVAQAEMGRTRKVAALVAVAALVGGVAGGAVVALMFGQH